MPDYFGVYAIVGTKCPTHFHLGGDGGYSLFCTREVAAVLMILDFVLKENFQ